MELAGRVALVTGGSRGIGAATALRLAREGADVAITWVSRPLQAEAVVAQVEALGRRALAIEADGADGEAVVRAVERTVSELGRLDILVNNAGVWLDGPFEQVAVEDLDRLLAIHVRGVFLAAQAAVRHMHDGGTVLNIGSCIADRAGAPGVTTYAMTKAALSGFTKGLAWDLGSRGITANVIHPGPVDTDMNPADGPHADAMRAGIATGAYGSAEDVAAMIAHLAGPAGRYVTGASIALDGGVNA
jgi:NAD(P)-dependent dehydrogenase (short-subunit alcohol dehydrogenase family)